MENEDFFNDVDLTEDQGCFCILDSTGDTKIIWNKKNKEEVKNAKKQFEELVGKKNWAAFEVGRFGKKNEDKKITEFDEGLSKIILIPPMAGG